MPQSGANEIWTQNFQLNPQVEYLIERVLEECPEMYDNLNLVETF